MAQTPINRRGRWYKSHKKHIDKEVNVNFNQVKAGMILHINYKSDSRPAPKKSMYLVIQPKFDNLLHVLDLDYVKPEQMRLILTKTKENQPSTWEISTRKKCTLLEFQTQKQALYTTLSRIGDLKDAYRHLHRDKMHAKTMTAVTYLFPTKWIPRPDQTLSEDAEKQSIDISEIQDLVEGPDRP